MASLHAHAQMQDIARQAMRSCLGALRPGLRLTEVRLLLEEAMRHNGADSFWYWGIGAFVFHGTDTATSISGREYSTADTPLQEADIVTVDLSPQREGVWGDYARTIVIEHQQATEDPNEVEHEGWRAGLQAEAELHRRLLEIARPSMTMEDLYLVMNAQISDLGFESLDFHGNLGHTIESSPAARRYIERGNDVRLGEVALFTFEPHIRRRNGAHGYKREDIYYFDNGVLRTL